MPGVDLKTQKRRGLLQKTPEMISYSGHIYGNTHRSFGVRRPTPTASSMPGGFYGLGSMMNGDGKMHYFGNDQGQHNLAPPGLFGFGGSEMDYQVADIMLGEPTHADEPGLFGDITASEGFVTSQTLAMVLGTLGLVYVLKKN